VITVLLIASLATWYRMEGTVSVESIVSSRAEWFYWITILFSQTLGTALGDWVAGDDRGGLGIGYEYSAMLFGAGLVVVAALYFSKRVSRTALFWAAFILTRPLGATLGDFFDKPLAQGGLQINRLLASALLLAFIVVCIVVIPQRAARRNAVV
jgi:uncharacterized membrane-anchored protein